MKRYLLSMSVLLLFALISGIGVWFLYQDMNVTELIETEKENESSISSITENSERVTLQDVEMNNEPVNITAESLSDEQRSMLESLGYGGTNFTISEDMIVCAKAEVGEKRLREIIDGAAPSPVEALSLLPCMKAQ